MGHDGAVNGPEPEETEGGPAWPDLEAWVPEAGNLVDLVPADEATGRATFDALDGVTDDSMLGALALHAGAIVVDDWLVLLGAGTADVPGLREVNGRIDGGLPAIPGALVVAIDRLGGGFAINAGGLPEGEVGEVCYLAPDDLEWMACGFGHGALIDWAFEGDIDGFYADIRWPSWREESAALGAGRGFNAYPPPWADGGDADDVNRAPVPLAEAWRVVLATSLTQGTWTPAGTR